MTLKGLGLPGLRGGSRGDLHVVLRVVVPQDLDAEQIELAAALEGTIDEANLNVDGGKGWRSRLRGRRGSRQGPKEPG